jgi:hypothetical protein
LVISGYRVAVSVREQFRRAHDFFDFIGLVDIILFAPEVKNGYDIFAGHGEASLSLFRYRIQRPL